MGKSCVSIKLKELLFGLLVCLCGKSTKFLRNFSYFYSGYEIVSLARFKKNILAGTNGKFYELDPANGNVVLKNGLKGDGYSNISLGTYGPYNYTDYNSTTIIQCIAESRRKNNKKSLFL